MNVAVRLIMLLMLFLTSQSGIATTTKFTAHQYDVNHIALSEGIYGYDTNSHPQHCCQIPLVVNTQNRYFLAFVSDFLVTKSVDIKVLGRQWDTNVAKNWDGHDVLDLPKGTWNKKKNDQWVSQGIKNKQEFYTASPTKNNLWKTIGDRPRFIGINRRQTKVT